VSGARLFGPAWLTEGVKEALLQALVALILAVPLIGLKTVQEPGGLGLQTRWPAVAIAVACVFVGRLLLVIARHVWPPRPKAAQSPVVAARIRRFVRLLGPAAIAFALLLPFMPFADRYVLDVSILVLTYVMLGWGLNIVVGLAGLLDLGYVAFYAVGAYSYALFAANFGLSFWACLPIAGALAATFGILLGFPVLRLRGDYLAIVTLGFGEMIRVILIN